MSSDGYEVARVQRTREEARRSYDRISSWYDLVEGSWEKKLRRGGLELLAPAPGEAILEIGFGTGHALEAIAAAVGESGRAYGIDIAPEMLRLAQGRLIESGLASRAELTNGDALDLPYDDDMMDAVFMSFTLELFDTPEIPEVLSECRRVLRPGGRTCVVSLSRAGPQSRMKQLYEWGHRKLPALLDCRPIYAGHFLEEAGFNISKSMMSSIWGLPVETVLAFEPGRAEGEES